MRETACMVEQVPAPPVSYRGRLVIFTSFYKHQGYAGYIHSLALTGMVFSKLGIEWDYWPYSGDFHVERALNKALTLFMKSDATDFLCIDSDEAWDPAGLLRLITRPAEIIGGAYKKTNKWHEYTCAIKTDANGAPIGELVNGEPVLECDRLPAGFLRITKPVLQKFSEAYPERWYWDTDDQTGEKLKVHQFFTTSLRDHEMFSQDYNFSEDLKSLGVRLWLEPNITIGHFGIVEHVGNVDKSLRENKASRERTPMENIEAFAKQVTRSAA